MIFYILVDDMKPTGVGCAPRCIGCSQMKQGVKEVGKGREIISG